jgi:hypothetical protein
MADQVSHQQLVALAPGDLPQAQTALTDFCLQKMRALGQEYRELSENLRIAKKNRWRTIGLRNAVSRSKRTIQYYQKIRLAVQAGYLIIPNFPVETIAVRVDSNAPPLAYATYPTHINGAQANLLPAGTGHYVDETIPTRDASYYDRDPKTGKEELRKRVQTDAYNTEIDFPVIAVKPIIMQATARAMALRLFDEIGIANHAGSTTSRARRRADPIVVGRIYDPRVKYRDKVVTFFVAWWLDTQVL